MSRYYLRSFIMNKKIPFMLLAVSSILLTACESKLTQEKFVEKLNATKANVVITSDKLNNVHMQNRFGIHKMNYKEGEYFTDETAGVVIIIPIITKHFYWAEGGKYYHAEVHTNSKNDKYLEITKEAFDGYMQAGKAKICEYLNQGINECEKLMNPPENDDSFKYYDIKNGYKKNAYGEIQMTSTMKYKYMDGENEVEKSRTVKFYMKNDLPLKYDVKDDGSESFYKYSFGKAELNKPEKPSSN